MIRCSNYSEQGIREVQQDRTLSFELSGLCTVLVVCDGMGGAGGGEVAEVALKASVSDFLWMIKDSNLSDESLQKAVISAIKAASLAINKAKNNHPEWEDAGSTITLAVIDRKRVVVGWVGDSPAYLYDRGNGLCQLTRSHSSIEEYVARGMKREDFAGQKGFMANLTRVLGYPGCEEPDCVSVPLTKNGTIVFLCSDGVSNYLSKSEMVEILVPEQTCVVTALPVHLVKKAFLNGSDDNLTVALTVANPDVNLGDVRKTRLIRNKNKEE